MRALRLAVVGVLGVLGVATPSAADVVSVVIPGKRGVPVIIHGLDASWCVVEGELGLDRPGQVTPTIIDCPPVLYAPVFRAPRHRAGHHRGRSGHRTARVGGYFPESGRQPGYGRREVEPPRDRPLP